MRMIVTVIAIWAPLGPTLNAGEEAAYTSFKDKAYQALHDAEAELRPLLSVAAGRTWAESAMLMIGYARASLNAFGAYWSGTSSSRRAADELHSKVIQARATVEPQGKKLFADCE